jgi:hypothetical protein
MYVWNRTVLLPLGQDIPTWSCWRSAGAGGYFAALGRKELDVWASALKLHERRRALGRNKQGRGLTPLEPQHHPQVYFVCHLPQKYHYRDHVILVFILLKEEIIYKALKESEI